MSEQKAPTLENMITIKAVNLTLPRRAAAHKMTTKVPVLYPNQSIADARRLVIEKADDMDTINYLYIVNKQKKLKGVINIKDIFRKTPEIKLSEVMEKKLVKARVDTDYEQAAHMALKNNIKAIPLVNKKNELMGVLASDQVLSIVENESRDDLLKLSGIILGRGKRLTGNIKQPVFASFASRIPWILVGLFGGIFTARVISTFEGVLSEKIILASFIPLVAYVANAVGTQSQTLYIRDLATQPKFSFTAYLLKQFVTASLIGVTCLFAILGVSLMFWGDLYIGAIVGIALFIAIFVATGFALLIPRILDKMDIDPATGSGPATTVVQDFLSIVIYLFTASIFI